jgi:hypothetical protein
MRTEPVRLLGACLLGAAITISLAAAPDPTALKVQGPDTLGNLLQIQTFFPSATGSTGQTLSNSATGAASAITATLTSTVGQTAWVTGFEVTGAGATGASVIVVTITGGLGGTLSYDLVIPAGVTTSITPLIVEFPQPLPANGTNTNIVCNVPSFGAGNTNSAAVIHGFRQ